MEYYCGCDLTVGALLKGSGTTSLGKDTCGGEESNDMAPEDSMPPRDVVSHNQE